MLCQMLPFRHYDHQYLAICSHVMRTFTSWRATISPPVLQARWREELLRLKEAIGALHFSPNSTEVTEACNQWYEQLSRVNPNVSSSRIWSEVINPKRGELAEQISTSKQTGCRTELSNIFSSRLSPSLGTKAYNLLVDAFMNGNIQPLADALVNHDKTQAQNTAQQQFPHSSMSKITLALNESDEGCYLAAANVGVAESRKQLTQQRTYKHNLETGFEQIHLQKEPEPINLTGRCFWVPASVRHEVQQEATSSSLSRHSFFVYGGVNIQPRINQVSRESGALRGRAVARQSFNSVNSQAAMGQKMRVLESAQKNAVKTQTFDDSRVRYYKAETPARTPGSTRGAAHVTEHNTKTGQVRSWHESYDHSGSVNRVHMKTINGQHVSAQHYPPTQAELRSWGVK